MKKIRKIMRVLPLIVVAALMLAKPVSASPIEASGTITPPTSLGDIIKVADGNTFFFHHDTHTLTGTLSGTTTEDSTLVINFSTGQGSFHGFLFFTGTANGVSGTLTLQLDAVVNLPGVQGNLAIVSGGGGLANLKGQGTWGFTNLSLPGTYSAQINFV